MIQVFCYQCKTLQDDVDHDDDNDDDGGDGQWTQANITLKTALKRWRYNQLSMAF